MSRMVIKCCVCDEECAEEKSSYHKDMNGDACPECHFNLRASGAWLDNTNTIMKGEGIKGCSNKFNGRIKQ